MMRIGCAVNWALEIQRYSSCSRGTHGLVEETILTPCQRCQGSRVVRVMEAQMKVANVTRRRSDTLVYGPVNTLLSTEI